MSTGIASQREGESDRGRGVRERRERDGESNR
jgi:hypothetical protein